MRRTDPTGTASAKMTEAAEAAWIWRGCWPTRCGRSSRRDDAGTRVESTLTAITEQAAAELSSWADELSEGELRRAPRPAQLGPARRAVVVGGAAAGGLVLVGMRRRGQRHSRASAAPPSARCACGAVGRPRTIHSNDGLRRRQAMSSVAAMASAMSATCVLADGAWIAPFQAQRFWRPASSAGAALPTPWPRRSPGGGRAGGETGEAEDQVQEVVLGVDRDEAEDEFTAADR